MKNKLMQKETRILKGRQRVLKAGEGIYLIQLETGKDE